MTRLRPDGSPFPAYLLHGEDAGLVSQELSALLDELVALDGAPGDQRDLVPVEEYGESGRDEPLLAGPILDACRTPPFLARRRVVVLRDTSLLDAAQTKEVAAYLAEPLETTVLVLVHPGRSAPAALARAVRAQGLVLDAEPAATSRARSQWMAERLKAAPVRLNAAAAVRLEEHLGEDLARLEGILGALHAAFGDGATLDVSDIEPFLGTAGGVAPWDLTDALDRGDTAAAVDALHRLLEAGGRHPLQVLATLHRHLGAMLRLDGSGVSDEAGAAALTGMRPFPAKKALTQCNRLGHERLARAVELLAAADLDLRGALGWPPELVLEVLVARLAQLSRIRPGSVQTRTAPSGSRPARSQATARTARRG